LHLLGHIRLSCRVGNHTTEVPFLVLEHLAVPLILGCDYIDDHVRNLQPVVGRLTLVDGSQVSLIRKPVTSSPEPVRCARQRILPSWPETTVLVVSTAEGLFRLAPQARASPTVYQMADGIAHITSRVPFHIRVVNLSSHDIQLNKGTLLGSAHMDLRHVVGIIEVGHISVRLRTADESTLPPQLTKPEWASAMDLCHLSEETRAQVIETLTPFARMWDGNLGEINTTPHRIELTPGAKPVFQPPYRAGKAGREVEKREIERMLKVNGYSRELAFLRTTSQSTGGSSVFIDFGHCLQ
jgi:hypothetical protein